MKRIDSMDLMDLMGSIAIVLVALALIGCFIAPLFIYAARELWAIALA